MCQESVTTKRKKWERIKSDWPDLQSFILAWMESEIPDKFNRPIKGGKFKKVEVTVWPSN